MILNRLTHWPERALRNPLEELDNIRKQMEWLVGGLTGSRSSSAAAGVFPLLNVTEDADNYYVRAELPGIKAEELDINVTGNSLTISGERKLEAAGENSKYHRREREAGSFSRIIDMPGQIDADKAEATSVNGILTVTLRKAESAKPRQISVKAK